MLTGAKRSKVNSCFKGLRLKLVHLLYSRSGSVYEVALCFDADRTTAHQQRGWVGVNDISQR